MAVGGQLVEGDEQGQHHQRGSTAGLEGLASWHLGPAHAREDVDGLVSVLVTFGLTLGLEVQDQTGERASTFFIGAHVMLRRAPADDRAS